MQTKLIRESIAEILRTVDGIGPVYSYIVSPSTPSDFKKICGNIDHMEWWQIYRTGINGIYTDTRNFNSRVQPFSILGFYGHSNGPESTDSFDSIVNEVFETMSSIGTIGNLVAQVVSLEAPILDLATIGSILCHRCTINMTLMEFSS